MQAAEGRTGPIRALAWLMVLSGWITVGGCGMDKGATGEIPPENLFLDTQGCLEAEAGEEAPEPLLLAAPVPYGVSVLEARLEVMDGEADMVLGTKRPPSAYFGLGTGTGIRKILVGTSSYVPLEARTWRVELHSPTGFAKECPEGEDADWRLVVRRAQALSGDTLLEHEGGLGACSAEACPEGRFEVSVPEDASTVEVLLESVEGDADLFVGTGERDDLFESANPGPGYDVVFLSSETVVPLRGGTIVVRLESWGQASTYRLRAVYRR